VDPNQHKDKNCYYHNFKTQLRGQPGQEPGHRLGGSTQVDIGQRIDKNIFLLKNIFFIFSNCFDVLILKIIFLK
jgi:hypothetical protein